MDSKPIAIVVASITPKRAESGEETKRPALRQVKWENEDILTAKLAVLF
jgi:hypothetical protein